MCVCEGSGSGFDLERLRTPKFHELCITKNWGRGVKRRLGTFPRIIVNPYSSLSLQMHKYRSEHWIVVSGKAKVQIGNNIKNLVENESIYISSRTKHRLSNPGENPLILIEVQSGTYVGEDDIIRFEDNYGRKDKI